MSKKTHNILQWPKGSLDFSTGPLIMGILNVTPDSFSDGGHFLDIEKAVQHGLRMAEHGAAIIDVGAESTRPGSEPVSTDQQIARAIPVIETLAKKIDISISIDTHNYQVARSAVDAGASIINDITALNDERMAQIAAEQKLPVILMHMQADPATMQIEPKYEDVVTDVLDFLIGRAKRAEQAGIEKEKIFLDPGIGFGKTTEHNLLLLSSIHKFIDTGYRVLIGTSRKGFIGQITGRQDPAERIFGTAATVALCAAEGVSVLRVHDVAEMNDVVKTVTAIKRLSS